MIQPSVLPKRDPSRAAAVARSGCAVHGQPLAGVEQLDEQPGLGAEARRELVAEPAGGIGRNRLAQQRPVGQARDAGRRVRAGRQECGGNAVTEPTQSSGPAAPALPRKRSMPAPPA